MLNEIQTPYIIAKGKKMNLQGKPWLLICNVFKVQWTDAVKDVKKFNR